MSAAAKLAREFNALVRGQGPVRHTHIWFHDGSLALDMANFNPDQPRAKNGRWTKGASAGGETAAAPKATKAKAPKAGAAKTDGKATESGKKAKATPKGPAKTSSKVASVSAPTPKSRPKTPESYEGMLSVFKKVRGREPSQAEVDTLARLTWEVSPQRLEWMPGLIPNEPDAPKKTRAKKASAEAKSAEVTAEKKPRKKSAKQPKIGGAESGKSVKSPDNKQSGGKSVSNKSKPSQKERTRALWQAKLDGIQQQYVAEYRAGKLGTPPSEGSKIPDNLKSAAAIEKWAKRRHDEDMRFLTTERALSKVAV